VVISSFRGLLASALLLLALTAPRSGHTEERKCQAAVSDVAAGKIQKLVGSNWTACRLVTVKFRGSDFGDATAALFESTTDDGTDGIGNPEHNVEMIIVGGGQVLYRFSQFASFDRRRFFVDDDLEVRDLTGHGDNAVVFHSGQQGASDSSIVEHVIYLPPQELLATDVSPTDFVSSWRQAVRWIQFKGIPLVLVAEPLNPASINDVHMCHSCPKYYQYLVYRWDTKRQSFVVRQSILSEHDLDAETDPIDASMSLIQRELARN